MVARGSPLPLYINPAEFLLDLTSTDFSQHDESAKNDTQKFIKDWQTSASAEALRAAIASLPALKEGEIALPESTGRTSFFNLVLTLLHRSFIKSYRDIVAYGIRSVMYIGLAVMMGTVWLRLPETQSSIGPFTNAIVNSLLQGTSCQFSSLFHSSSDRRSCHSWPLPTSLPSSKTAPHSSKSVQMVYMALLHSCCQTS